MGHSKKLLIVDDQCGIRLLLQEVFKGEGYVTLEASNGNQAIALVESTSPDLMLLDMKIPGIDGLQVLQRTKEINPSIKVIMMTAYGELNLISQAKQYGASKYFTKPFDIDELREAVKLELYGSVSVV
jgi:two-component system response regulator (stage 0 sporulation protein F)